MKKTCYLRNQFLLVIFALFIICFGILPSNGGCGENTLPTRGVWEGHPEINFEVNSNSDVVNFTLTELIGPSKCKITIDKIKLGKDGDFAISQFIPEKNYWLKHDLPEDERRKRKEEIKKKVGYWPKTIKKNGAIMVEIVRIIGKFSSPTSLSGNYIILNCDDQQFFHNKKIYESGKEWNAVWKRKK